ncbi:B12-binding domain-containing radical SAM protein [candidate division CSSED10-310 bacterium]|uniref:B12-binding domain-containing radical SAM protein n=1 Tax=candidate division CSSED10-310 bacterium TaxID=2855610 RepID=A0ABV6Z4S3_UNCC1
MPSKKKIVLLNPPAWGAIVHRDGYCSSSSKLRYTWHPLDLLLQSGYLQKHHLVVIDAVAEKLSQKKVIQTLRAFEPQVILALVASITVEQDISFLKRISELIPCQIFVSGDFPLFSPARTFDRMPFLQGILTDFTSDALLTYLDQGQKSSQLWLREEPGTEIPRPGPFLSYPLPAHFAFSWQHYSMPFYKQPFASVLFSYGCPFNCFFCNTHLLGYKIRDSGHIIEELCFLKEKGIRNLYIRDATLNGNINKLKTILQAVIASGLKFKWNAFVTPLPCDQELVSLMKDAGCFLVQIGIETGCEEDRVRLGKKITNDAITQTIDMFQTQGIMVSGHFMIGSPFETVAHISETKKFSAQLDLDFISLNITSARPGTVWNQKTNHIQTADSSGNYQISSLSSLDLPTLKKWKRKILVSFYLGKRNVIKTVNRIRTKQDLMQLADNSISFLRSLI